MLETNPYAAEIFNGKEMPKYRKRCQKPIDLDTTTCLENESRLFSFHFKLRRKSHTRDDRDLDFNVKMESMRIYITSDTK